MNMKKYLLAMIMLLATGLATTTPAQPPAKDTTELVDTTHWGDALEAYSDTTGVADTTVVSRHHRIGGYSSTNGSDIVNDILDGIGMEGVMGMAFVLLILFIIFVLSPVLIMIVLFYFIYKNRKQKIRLAEMAMKQGQPIPDQLLMEHQESDDDVWQKGIRQTFLGVGLLTFFGYIGSTLGIGIGILVTAIGLGKLVIVKTSKKS
mgnify:CR=1 FL=1